MLYQTFCKYIKRERLFEGRSRFLLAVSGGVDSVVLTDLMARYVKEQANEGVELVLAHCNFHLRGEESDRDEKFVRELAAHYGFPLFVKGFDTVRHAERFKQSIEMAARELRYLFFSKLMVEQKMEACLLAHHADDNAETFFINLFRGSAVKGLRGMLPCSWKSDGKAYVYLRPLLWARRVQIQDYAHERGLEYVEDSTNAEQVYLRNKIRHTVLPLLEEVSEGFTDKLSQSMESLRRVDALLDDWYLQVEKKCTLSLEEGEEVPFSRVESLGEHLDLFLELYLRRRNFSRAQIEQVLGNYHNGISGKTFENTDGTAVWMREPKGWRLYGARAASPASLHTQNASPQPKAPKIKQYEALVIDKKEINPSPRIAYLCYEKLQFPLKWRHPQPGDKFKPLGTRGFKKLSDFFKDEKVSVSEREDAWLLCSGGDIVWVAGYRIDDRYKLSPDGSTPRRAWVVEMD